MSDKLIAYTMPDGSTRTYEPSISTRRVLRNIGGRNAWESELQWLTREAKRGVPVEATDVCIITKSSVPAARSFRGAWRLGADGIGFDMPKAREMHRDAIRQARGPLLAKLDVEMSRAFNDPARQGEIEEARQMLRDAPSHPDIEAAQTPEELWRVWPLDGAATLPERKPAALTSSSGLPVDIGHPERVAVDLPLPEPVQDAKRVPWTIRNLVGEVPPLAPESAHQSAPETPLEPILPPVQADKPVPLPDMPSVVAPMLDDATRRRVAKAIIRDAVIASMSPLTAEQARYELALQARNNQAFAVDTFAKEAATLGMTVQDLAAGIIQMRRVRERRMGHIYELQAQAVLDIDAASGDAIDAISARVVAAIGHASDDGE